MFEKAARLKLRFDSIKGQITVEDLWDLPLTSERGDSLNRIGMVLQRQLKDSAEESLVAPPVRSGDEIPQLKLDIIKHIIAVRQAENEALRSATARREQKAKLLAIIERKQNEKLEGASLEELTAMVEAL